MPLSGIWCSDMIRVMPPEPVVYEARYGLNRQSGKVIGGSLIFCAVILLIPSPLWARILVVGFFGLCALVLLSVSLTRKTALRVDSAGVTTRSYPLQPRSTRFYRWEDIDKILIWQYQRMKSVGIQRRDAAAPLTNRPIRSISRGAVAITAPGIPPEVAATGVAANGWALDLNRLAQAVAHFAPTVPVLDTTTGRLLNPSHPEPPGSSEISRSESETH